MRGKVRERSNLAAITSHTSLNRSGIALWLLLCSAGTMITAGRRCPGCLSPELPLGQGLRGSQKAPHWHCFWPQALCGTLQTHPPLPFAEGLHSSFHGDLMLMGSLEDHFILTACKPYSVQRLFHFSKEGSSSQRGQGTSTGQHSCYVPELGTVSLHHAGPSHLVRLCSPFLEIAQDSG